MSITLPKLVHSWPHSAHKIHSHSAFRVAVQLATVSGHCLSWRVYHRLIGLAFNFLTTETLPLSGGHGALSTGHPSIQSFPSPSMKLQSSSLIVLNGLTMVADDDTLHTVLQRDDVCRNSNYCQQDGFNWCHVSWAGLADHAASRGHPSQAYSGSGATEASYWPPSQYVRT